MLNRQFDDAVVPHLDAAYNLARWLLRNPHDAEDVVQEACLRALSFFHTLRSENGRPWLLAIVRNTCYTWLRKNRPQEVDTVFDEQVHSPGSSAASPEAMLIRKAGSERVRQALQALPPEFREVLVLREMEGLSYRQIAEVSDLPIGTVMSRLARARRKLAQQLGEQP